LIRRRPNASPSSTTSRSALWNPAWIRTNSVGMCVLYIWMDKHRLVGPFFHISWKTYPSPFHSLRYDAAL
jgi:hypothetical protein